MDNSSKCFSISKLHEIIINNFGKISICCIGIVVLTFLFDKRGYLYVYIYPILVLSFLHFVVVIFCKTFAQSVTFNKNEKIVELVLSRNNGLIKIKYEDIKKIYISGYVLFYFENRRVMFNDLTNDEIYKYINDVGDITWGPLAFLDNQKSRFNKSIQRPGV